MSVIAEIRHQSVDCTVHHCYRAASASGLRLVAIAPAVRRFVGCVAFLAPISIFKAAGKFLQRAQRVTHMAKEKRNDPPKALLGRCRGDDHPALSAVRLAKKRSGRSRLLRACMTRKTRIVVQLDGGGCSWLARFGVQIRNVASFSYAGNFSFQSGG